MNHMPANMADLSFIELWRGKRGCEVDWSSGRATILFDGTGRPHPYAPSRD